MAIYNEDEELPIGDIPPEVTDDSEIDRLLNEVEGRLERKYARPQPTEIIPMPELDVPGAALAKLREPTPMPVQQPIIEQPAPPVEQTTAQPSSLSNLLELQKQLANAQRSRRENLSNLALAQAASTIGQSIGEQRAAEGKLPGKEQLEKLAEEPITALQEQISGEKTGRDLELMGSMADPESDISKVARQIVKQRFPNMNIEGMSAAQLQKLGFKLGTLGQEKKGVEKSPKILGIPINYKGKPTIPRQMPDGSLQVLDPDTGKWVAATSATRAYQKQKITVPGSKEVGLLGQEGDVQLVTGPGVTPIDTQSPKPVQLYSSLAEQSKKDISKASDKFKTINKDQLTSYNTIDSIMDSIDDAMKNEVAASQLGARVAKVFEGGRLTDEDVVRYTARKSLASVLQDYAQKKIKGTITPELASQIRSTLDNYKKSLQGTLSKAAHRQAKEIIAPVYSVSPKYKELGGTESDLAQLLYGDYTPQEIKVRVRRKADGKIKLVKPSDAKKYLSDPGFEKVD